MAKLTALPELDIISGFKGTIDFYVYLGIPVARRWPRSPGSRRATAVEAQWFSFSWASANWNSLSKEVQDAYKTTSSNMPMSGRDLFTKGFIKDYFREGQWD